MLSNWTFGKKIAGGFAIVVGFIVVVGAIASMALNQVVASKDRVITFDAPFLVRAELMRNEREQMGIETRDFLLTGTQNSLDDLTASRSRLVAMLRDLKDDSRTTEGVQLAAAIEQAYDVHRIATDRVVAMRQSGVPIEEVVKSFNEQIPPAREALDKAINQFSSYRQSTLDADREASSATASLATIYIAIVTVLGAAIAAFLAFFLARTLNRQIGSAVGHVESSSAELQSAANQQATGVKEQVSSMNEINTTISELLATSRQIAESAQRVAQIAEETTTAAGAGDGTVERAGESIFSIRHQVDLVVGHMLELGKKSQQIGAVLDLVSELAEQTNILSINATIEAAGAGEAGKRFAIVADEIRKLADRVTASAKEIRTLIDDVRSSVNTTVMATETGSKAVDTGSRQFGDVATAFRQIAELVKTTTEAAREIELSTRQQATAVEQVNTAIANVSQATRETEASAGQTIQTASALATTSRDLLRLVKARAA